MATTGAGLIASGALGPPREASPEETLVRNIVARWHAERTCVYCAKPIRELGGAVVPALLSASGELCEWKDVADTRSHCGNAYGRA